MPLSTAPTAAATTWLRKRGEPFCAVLTVDDASVATHCNVVWDTATLIDFELHDAPHVAEQCPMCVAAIAMGQQRDAAADAAQLGDAA